MGEQITEAMNLMTIALLAQMDIKNRMINIIYCIPPLLIMIVIRIIYCMDCKDALIGMIFGGVMVLAAKLTRESIGYGDALILMFMGLSLGFKKSILVLLITVGLISIVGLVLLAFGKVSKHTSWPMVPWMLAAMLIGVSIWHL